jgi:hypothetical protein
MSSFESGVIMKSWLEALSRVVLDRSIEELFGAILLSLVLATLGAGLGRRLCRSGTDVMARLTGVMLVPILIGMCAGATLIQSAVPAQPQIAHRPSEFSTTMGPSAFHQMIFVLDADADGRVDPEELRKASVALGTQDRLPPESPSGPVGGAAGPEAPEDLVVPLDRDRPPADAADDRPTPP